VALSGLILVSCAMDLQTPGLHAANDLPYALFLPAFANVSQYHGLLKGALGASPRPRAHAAEAFVADEYLAALHAGARAGRPARTPRGPPHRRTDGPAARLVEEHNLRISDQTYFFEALRPQGRMVGRLDARATGPMGATRGRDWEFDPGIEAIAPAYTAAALAYFGQTLGLEMEQRYEVLSHATHKAWNWNRGDSHRNGFASTTPDLARALRRNPHLRCWWPAAATTWARRTAPPTGRWRTWTCPADVAARITHHYYDAGHMMYTRSEDLAAQVRPGRLAG
jgi:carboxypeptidase C (cathepsin A)